MRNTRHLALLLVLSLLLSCSLFFVSCKDSSEDTSASQPSSPAASTEATSSDETSGESTTADPTDTPTPLPTDTPTQTVTETPSPVPTETPTPEPTSTPVPTETPVPTNTPEPTEATETITEPEESKEEIVETTPEETEPEISETEATETTPPPATTPQPSDPPGRDLRGEYDAVLAHIKNLGYTVTSENSEKYKIYFSNATGTYNGYAIVGRGEREWTVNYYPVDGNDPNATYEYYNVGFDPIAMLNEIDPSWMNYGG